MTTTRILSLLILQTLVAAQVAHRQPDTVRDERERPEVKLVSFVLDDVQKNWDRILPAQAGVPYRHAKLVLYRNSFPSACGRASMATGPFYCPGDEKVYLDLGFFNELKRRFGAPGEFAQAYVIAHEIGHHVQKLLGTEGKVRRLRQQDPREANPLSVRLELQADYLAGVWAHSTEAAEADQSERRECRHARRGGCWRRQAATHGAGLCESRIVHARNVGRARSMVQAGLRYRANFILRYLQIDSLVCGPCVLSRCRRTK